MEQASNVMEVGEPVTKKQRLRIELDDLKYDFDKKEYDYDPLIKRNVVLRDNTIYRRPTKSEKLEVLRQSEETDVERRKNMILKMQLRIKHCDVDGNDILSNFDESSHKIQKPLVKKEETKSKQIKRDPSLVTEFDAYDDQTFQQSDDPLADEIYHNYHQKMLRQENRMLERDVNEAEFEADKLALYLDKLGMLDWRLTLPKITVIKNIADEEEMEDKKKKTIEYIQEVLNKYKEVKRQSALISRGCRKANKIDPIREWYKIFRSVDKSLVSGYQSSSDEEEENMTNEEIKKYRTGTRRRQKLGGSIKIGLTLSDNKSIKHRKFVIISNPLRTPFIVKLDRKERKEWNMHNDQLAKRIVYKPVYAKQIAVKERVLVISHHRPNEEKNNIKKIIETTDEPVKIEKTIVTTKTVTSVATTTETTTTETTTTITSGNSVVGEVDSIQNVGVNILEPRKANKPRPELPTTNYVHNG